MRFCRTFLLIFHILCSKKISPDKLNESYSISKMLLLAVQVITDYVTTIYNGMAYTLLLHNKHWHKLPLLPVMGTLPPLSVRLSLRT